MCLLTRRDGEFLRRFWCGFMIIAYWYMESNVRIFILGKNKKGEMGNAGYIINCIILRRVLVKKFSSKTDE